MIATLIGVMPSRASIGPPVGNAGWLAPTPFGPILGATGCGAVWLARLTGGQEVAGSNPVSPMANRPRRQSPGPFRCIAVLQQHLRATGQLLKAVPTFGTMSRSPVRAVPIYPQERNMTTAVDPAASGPQSSPRELGLLIFTAILAPVIVGQ